LKALSSMRGPRLDVNAKDEGGLTALHWAAQAGNVNCLKMILDCGDVDPTVTDNEGMTPLHVASLEVIKQL